MSKRKEKYLKWIKNNIFESLIEKLDSEQDIEGVMHLVIMVAQKSYNLGYSHCNSDVKDLLISNHEEFINKYFIKKINKAEEI